MNIEQARAPLLKKKILFSKIPKTIEKIDFFSNVLCFSPYGTKLCRGTMKSLNKSGLHGNTKKSIFANLIQIFNGAPARLSSITEERQKSSTLQKLILNELGPIF